MTKYDYIIIPNFCQNLRSTCNLADIDKHLDLDFTISDPPTLILPRPRPKLVSRGISATDYNYYCDKSKLEHIYFKGSLMEFLGQVALVTQGAEVQFS